MMQWFLSQDQQSGAVQIPTFLLNRIRVVLAFSLLLNVALFFFLGSLLKARANEGQLMGQVSSLGSLSGEMCDLYGLQLETLSTAYALYGRALQDGPDSTQNYQRYQSKLNEFNRRSNELVTLSNRIKKHIANMESL